ncbi:MAG: 30S ribosomal protein S6 [Desulfobacterales bacterium]|nr:30S ribosomal protein S6 [Desulfobacterales bacterium]
MRRYETFFISDPDLSDQDREQLFEKTKDLIAKQNGFLVLFDDWGNRKLAYAIKKKSRGYYVRIDFCGNGPLVDEMERSFRIDDRVLKFMTISLSKKEIDVEKLKEELAKEKAEAEKAIQEKEAEAETIETNSDDTPEVTTEAPVEDTQTDKEE